MTIIPSCHFFFIHAFILLSLHTNFALSFNFGGMKNIKCIETERQALLSFKYDLIDRDDILSSWRSEDASDCCSWLGVQCHNNSGHIISLDLHGPRKHDYMLKGKIGSSLANLSHLIYLDLSNNFFHQSSIFEDISSLVNLKYLNLSYNELKDVISPQLGNLSKLSILDLQHNYFHGNFGWISNLSSFKHLYLSGGDFSGANDWVSAISKLTLLESLYLESCNLPQPMLPSHSFTNFPSFLSMLDLRNNNLNSSIFPWLLKLGHSLAYLNLASNNLPDLTLDDFGNLTSLLFLDLCSTKVNLGSINSFTNLCNLESLFLCDNDLGGLLSGFLKIFPQCQLNSLHYLNLESNNFFGSLPNFSMFPSLKGLDLSYNMLNGTISQSLGELFDLEYLYLDYNSLEGEVSEAHFSKLTNLQRLHLSENSLIFNLKSNWVPPFQLESILLRSCKLGPLFPQWLQTQNFSFLDISNADISDVIPDWFWKNLSPNLWFLHISENKIKGEIPNFSLKFKTKPLIILGSNDFVGQIPPFLLQAEALDLTNNKFSDLTSLCKIANYSRLSLLDLSNNQFSGELPNCWDLMFNLQFLNLANNTFSGAIPRSMESLSQLSNLNLRNNQFSGEFPFWFNFTDLEVFDAMNNNFFGTIPSWIGSKLPNLVRLNLKSNHFHGKLPSSLCNLKSIQVLDISSNNITGSIPTCIHNFDVLTQKSYSTKSNYEWNFEASHEPWRIFYLSFGITYDEDMIMVWKGQEKLIKGKVLALGRSIDLSCNHLNGKIPNEFTKLVGLITLNLSRNKLTSRIPDEMGHLHSLESLDLSRNHFLGPIPFSFSQMSSLNVLDLSHNNLSGKIPTGTQLQSFPTSSYEGNSHLCGAPLQKCYKEINQKPDIKNNVHVEDENEDRLVIRELFISVSFGFIVGFWGIFGSLILHRRWRHVYFKTLNDIIGKVTCRI